MQKTVFQRLDDAFNRAIELDNQDRAVLLNELAHSDPDLLPRLQEMLLAADDTHDHLHASVQHATDAYAPKLPPQIGPFKVLKQLGVGGMGAVYLCTRADEDFTQLLAVKRLGRAAASTVFGRDRLVLERRMLARLRHPNIAQLVDGGDDDDGTPYVAMEYIEGTSILRYAESNKLDRKARLELFLPLCAAVQFAHRNSIIHRDLKPDNVLVDAHGQIKLLDFGIAKLLDQGDTYPGASLPTVAGAMTPHYASPEQVRGDVVSQASDIYSLGMMLYELLVGKRAYAFETTRPSDIERTICNTTPIAPSRATGWHGAAASDLDAIVLKSLHKEPERRYASAAQFGDDLQRWLDQRPVLARPDSNSYRVRTFARRHPLGVAMSFIGLLALTTFAVTMTWQANRLAHQRDVAEHQASVATESAEFLTKLFYASDPRDRNVAELTALDLLDTAAERLPDSMPSDPLTRARMMRIIGQAFAYLGEYERSIALLRQSLAIREKITGENSDETAESLNRLGNVLRQSGNLNEAEPMLRQALEWRSKQGSVDYDLADSYNNLGLLQRDLSLFDKAKVNLRQSIRLHEQAGGLFAQGLGAPLHNLAIVLREMGQLDEALAAAERSLEIKRKNELQVELVAHTQVLVATIERRMGRLDDALRNASESLDLRRSIYGDQSPLITRGIGQLAAVRQDRGEIELARELHQEALTIHRDANNQDSPLAANNHLFYGRFLLATGDQEQALKELQLARTIAGHFLQADSAALQKYEAAFQKAGLVTE